ncbi:hypothetical protein TWF506_005085 [Arthrobotrys conoides]|uniref:Uncharacterized protein n=1 Tax=Arthrobotrys conoides TaxID=74498 RepID=A0AAN8NB49_9PEZI
MFNLKGQQADGLIAPHRLTAQSDKLGSRILQQAQQLTGEPVWHKGCLLKNKAGDYIRIFELGYPDLLDTESSGLIQMPTKEHTSSCPLS